MYEFEYVIWLILQIVLKYWSIGYVFLLLYYIDSLKPLCIKIWTIYRLCLSQKKHMLLTNSHHENQLIIVIFFLHLFRKPHRYRPRTGAILLNNISARQDIFSTENEFLCSACKQISLPTFIIHTYSRSSIYIYINI